MVARHVTDLEGAWDEIHDVKPHGWSLKCVITATTQ